MSLIPRNCRILVTSAGLLTSEPHYRQGQEKEQILAEPPAYEQLTRDKAAGFKQPSRSCFELRIRRQSGTKTVNRNENDLPSDWDANAPFAHFIRQQDAGAFERLDALVRPRMLRIACGILKDPDEAQDIVQEVFKRLLEKREELLNADSEIPISVNWLYRSTANEALSQLRKRRNHKESSYDEMSESGQAPEKEQPDTHKYAHTHLSTQPPSAEEMLKVIEQCGEMTDAELEDLRKLLSPHLWKASRGTKREDKIDHEQLAKEKGLSDAAAYQFVSRLQRIKGRSILRRVGGMSAFRSLAVRALAWLRRLSERRTHARAIIGGIFILLGLLWWLASLPKSSSRPVSRTSLVVGTEVAVVETNRVDGATNATGVPPELRAVATDTDEVAEMPVSLEGSIRAPQRFWGVFPGFTVNSQEERYPRGEMGKPLFTTYYIIEPAKMHRLLLRQGLLEATVGVRTWKLSDVPPRETWRDRINKSSELLKRQRQDRLDAPEQSAMSFFARDVKRLVEVPPDVSFLTTVLDVGGYLRFSPQDVKEMPSLVTKLITVADPISAYMCSQFSEDERQMLRTNPPTNSEVSFYPKAPQQQLAMGIDRLLWTPSFYSEERFSGVRLSPQTQLLLKSAAQGEGIVRRNRALLQDAFPDEVVRNINVYRQPEITVRRARAIHDAVLNKVIRKTTGVHLLQSYRSEKVLVCVCSLEAESPLAPSIRVLLVAELEGQWFPKMFFSIAPSDVGIFERQIPTQQGEIIRNGVHMQ